MHHVAAPREFSDFAAQCRASLKLRIAPEDILWSDPFNTVDSTDLFAPGISNSLSASTESIPSSSPIKVPKDFHTLAHYAFHHSSNHRYDLIYRALWRISHGERRLLENLTDPLVLELNLLRKQVKRDAHKAKAFVRFRKVERGEETLYIAWHQPDHPILRLVSGFFRDRFATLNWTILTPRESVSWSAGELVWSEGVERDPIGGDDVENLWKTYYASTFNPARTNVNVMRTHMPARYWKSMPETELIPQLVHSSGDRTSAMLEAMGSTAVDFLPSVRTIETLKSAAQNCRGCPLYHNTNHAVCGEGPENARMALVGEQPGDQEDITGVPFIGPAGQVLNTALDKAGVPRELLYITETVKHFKHEMAGSRRLHRTPDSTDIAACRPWLLAEMEALKPKVLVCLGATAAQGVLGIKVPLKDVRGRILKTPSCYQTIVTTHPAAILRIPDQIQAANAMEQLVADLKFAWNLTL